MDFFNNIRFNHIRFHLHNNDGADDLHYFLEDGTLNMKIMFFIYATDRVVLTLLR